MKLKKLLFAALALLTALVITGCAEEGKLLNVKIMDSTETTVRFRPVCPDCDAVGDSRVEIMYQGEGDVFTDTVMCEECWYVFDIGIERY